MDVEACWRSHPQEWQPLFEALHSKNPDRTRIHTWTQLGGQRVLALTVGPVTDLDACRRRPFRLIITVPHAHEPACTAAVVNGAYQLLSGSYLDGTRSSLPIDAICDRSVVTFVPDTNSQGRIRSPQRCWNGEKYENEAFLKYAFGVAANGERFGRYPEWSLNEHRPERIGIVYEQLSEDVWVEPNTSRRSTHSLAIDALYDTYQYTHMLDMHQHESDEAALLPGDFEYLAEGERNALEDWAHDLIKAWSEAGATPRERPSIPYKGQPRQQFFIQFWQGRCPGMLRLVSEVRNNRHRQNGTPTSMAHQFRMACAALETTLKLAVKE